MTKLFIFASLLLMFLAAATCFSCNHGPPGRFCTSDLTGFYDCPYDGSKPTIVSCPVNTRCSCYLNNGCTVPKNKICTRYTKPTGLLKNFQFRYHGKISTYSPGGSHTTPTQGHILQNFATKRLSKTEWIGSKRHFEVVHPLRNGKFIKYSGNYPNVCKKTILTSFPQFGPNLTRFTLTSSHKRKYSYEETWKFLIGSRHMGQSTVQETWKMEKNRWTKKRRPLSYVYEFGGSAISKTNKRIEYTVGLYYSYSLGSKWFRKPNFC